jgi:16S rRNA (uracil1498-N3)-methyltransferase
MADPYFYLASLSAVAKEFSMDETASRHMVQVLRMQEGQELMLTDGRGLRAKATIRNAHKKHCGVWIAEKEFRKPDPNPVVIALSLLKNSTRFEWFLEKATELGVAEIIPLKCNRTEKQQFRMERMKTIIESALTQSQQAWMPVLQAPVAFPELVQRAAADQKLIGYCGPGEKKKLSELINTNLTSRLILIGPEGDFTEGEISLAFHAGFTAVSLGDHRLRSETAALASAALLKLAD